MQTTPSLPLLSGPLRPGVVAPDTGPNFGFSSLLFFAFKLYTYAKLNCWK